MDNKKIIKVSVVIPVYNSEKYIEECLDSLINQTLCGIEIICVDDGSEDDSLKILKWYENKYEQISVICQKNQYAGVARNNGMKLAHGKYVIFLDSDDIFKDSLLQKMYSKSESVGSDICICNASVYDNNTGTIYNNNAYLKGIPENDPFSWKDIPERLYSITTPAAWNMMYNMEFLKKNNLTFEECKRANDLRFFGCALPTATKITTIKDKLVLYRTGLKTNLQSMHSEQLYSEYNSLKQIRAYLKDKGLYTGIEKSYLYFCMNNIIYILGKKNNKERRDLISYINNDTDALVSLSQLEEIFGNNNKKYIKLESYFTSIDKEKNDEDFFFITKSENRKPVGVSVIVTAYNDSNYITECLNSIGNQSFDNFELIIVNDGSEDDTDKLCKEFIKNFKKQKVYIYKNNGGLSSARNCGLDFAMGKYVKFLDGDDSYTNDTLETCYNNMESFGVKVLFTNIKAYPDDYNDAELRTKADNFNKYYQRQGNFALPCSGKDMFIKMVVRKEYLESMGTMMFLRSFIEDNSFRFIENIYHEDDYFAAEIMLNADKVMYLDKTFYFRRVRHGSIMTNSKLNIEKGKSRLFIAEKLVSKYCQEAIKYNDTRLFFCLEKKIKAEINSGLNLIFPKQSNKRFKEIILPYSTINPVFYSLLVEKYNHIIKEKRLIKEKNDIRKSKTWKVTEPIRKVSRFIHKLFVSI